MGKEEYNCAAASGREMVRVAVDSVPRWLTFGTPVAQSFDEILSELVDQPEGLRDPTIIGHETNGLAAAHESASR
jgi:hypothetical protein